MIDVTIKTLDSQNHAFSVEDDTTVAQFKEKIAEVINIPVDSQRLIYCGRVLQDNKKLQEYDVHGKVVHLVQRAPPSTTRRARSPPPTNTTRRPFPGFNGSANAMYLGSMAFPSGLMEAQGIVPPPPTQSLSGSRLNVAKRMLRRAENILNHLEDPQGSRSRDSPPEEPQDEVTPVIAAQVFVPESAADDPIASLSAAVSAVENDILQRENGELVVSADLSLPEVEPQAPEQGATSSSTDEPQPADATTTSGTEPGLTSSSSNPEQMSSTSAEVSANGSTTRPSVSVTGSGRLPENSSGTIEMARLLDELNTVHTRLRPFMERYHTFMRTDPAVNSDQVPTVRETQTLINRVSEVMHLLGHAYHSLSDVMVQVSAAPPRPLLCRPILIQHSAVLQAGIPIQVEAQINLTSNRRPGDANSNAPPSQQQAGTGEQVPASDSGTTTPTTGTTPAPPPPPPPPQQPPTPGIHIRPNLHEIRFDSFPIEVRGFAGPRIISLGDPQVRRSTTQAPGPAPTTGTTFTTSTPSTNRTQPATSTDQNARSQFDGINPSNMEFFMEVTPESITIDSLGAAVVAPGPGENVVRGAFASAPPELIHSILQAVAGQMVGAGAPPPQQAPSAQAQQQQQQQQPSSTGSSTGAGTDTPVADTAQPCTVTQTSGAANGTNVNSQARGNTQTHPTTATQTRSTSRPHVHLAQHTMQGFDPFLPCNSHHIRHRRRPVPMSNAANANATSTSDASTTTTNATGDQAQNTQQQSPVYNFLQGLLRTISTATRQQGREQPTQHAPQQQESQQTASATTQAADPTSTQANNTTLPPFSTFLSSNSDFRQLQMRLLGQRGTGQGVTLATLLNNFPEYTEGESIFNDLIMTLAGELTFGDIVAINSGNFESLTRIRPTLRTFFADRVLQGENPTQDAVERATERLINELQPTLEIMGTMRVRDNIDIVESMSRLCRSRFLVIISLIMSQGSPANLMDQCILTVRQLCMLALHCSENGQPGVEEVFKALIGRYTEGVSQDIHQWTVNASLAQFREFMRALDVPVANITPYIATRSTSDNKSATNSTSQPEPQPMECEPVRVTETVVQPVQIPAAEALIDTEPLPNVLIGSEPWHRELPADWIPIITRDTQRQRRQNPQPPFSDAYLSGMPSKRRKVVSNAKSQTSISQAVSDGVRTAVTTVGLQTAVPLDVVTQAASSDASLRTAYSDLLRSTVVPGVIRNPDFTPERFPNLAKYFDIKKE